MKPTRFTAVALLGNARPGQGIHHVNFGLRLKEQMDKLGLECTIRHQDEG